MSKYRVLFVFLITAFLFLMPIKTTNVLAATTYDCGSQSDLLPADCEALVALYNSTNGPGWTNSTNWLSNTPSTWNGVTIIYQHVTNLTLYNNHLSGTIPTELGNLTGLQYLDLDNNQLTGSIPPGLGNLPFLYRVYLNGNQLTGSIPPELGNLTNLQHLYLNNNLLSGSIPSSLGNLTNLTNLYLFSNQLTGSIPSELGKLTNLNYLVVYYNQLSGHIPTELGNLVNLKRLELDSNQFTGSIPSSFGNLASIQFLKLGTNQLSGNLPPELGNLANLQQLSLYSNLLSGSIPSEFGNLANLTYLYLSDNQLSGSIPPTLGNLSKLQGLSLPANQLSGNLPPELGNLSNLGGLYLSSNQFTGHLPPELGNLVNLQLITLNDNQLSGSIPLAYKTLTKLKSFNAGNTRLCEPEDTDFQVWKATVTTLWTTPGLCSSISGVVTQPGGPRSGVTITNGMGTNATTLADGSYTLTDLISGSYTLTPTQTNQYFFPLSRNITITAGQKLTGIDFSLYLGSSITAISPATVTQGSSGFTLTITGSQFSDGFTVLWNGNGLTTTFVDSSHLTAVVPASTVTTAGTASISVNSHYTNIPLSEPFALVITPATNSGSTTSVVLPGSPTTINFTVPQNTSTQTSITVPAGAVATDTQLTYIETASLPATPGSGFLFGERSFTLTAYVNGQVQTGFNFAKPVRLVLSYPANMSSTEQNTLTLRYWNETTHQWSSDGITLVSRDLDNHQIIVDITHLSEFALMGQGYQIFLPISRK